MRVRSLHGQKLVNLPLPGAEEPALRQEQPPDRLIGQILRESKGLTDVQLVQILAYRSTDGTVQRVQQMERAQLSQAGPGAAVTRNR